MLTKAHALAEYDFRAQKVLPDRLRMRKDAAYLELAGEMLKVYRAGIGLRRCELHRRISALFFEVDCSPRRVESFKKLLDDASEYDLTDGRKAPKLRSAVFTAAANYHPLVSEANELFENQESAVKNAIAERLGRSWQDIEDGMFADVIEFRRLKSFTGYPDASALLRRYNVAQLQAALYDATEMRVWAEADYKLILRYAKLAGLMHDIERQETGYLFRFTGPASVLRESRRYGVKMAKFLPSLLRCSAWRMEADIKRFKGPPLQLDLSPECGYRSHEEPFAEFDSGVEEDFAQEWGPSPRDGWRLERESEVLSLGQKVFTPDFTFLRDDGKRVILEIVGFWTPEYLTHKAATLSMFPGHEIILAVNERAVGTFAAPGLRCIAYKTRLKIGAVLQVLQGYT